MEFQVSSESLYKESPQIEVDLRLGLCGYPKGSM